MKTVLMFRPTDRCVLTYGSIRKALDLELPGEEYILLPHGVECVGMVEVTPPRAAKPTKKAKSKCQK